MEEGDEGRQSWLRNKNWEKTWGKAYKTLKSLLTAEEWEKARDSTLNAHYTSRTVIEKMYDIVKRWASAAGGWANSAPASATSSASCRPNSASGRRPWRWRRMPSPAAS